MPSAPQLPSRDGPRVNEDIRVPQVRLIDQDGEMLGVMTSRDALYRAYSVGLDLLEISPNAVPPVCKITDYGKFKYEQQKKANEARKKQKVVEIKEIKVRPNIDDHDYDTKMKQMKGFIADGDKVKVTLRFRGREMAHQELGVKVLERVKAELAELAKVGFDPVYGARPLKRAIQQRIENPLSKLLLEGKFLPQQVVAISVDPVRFPGEFKFTPQDAPTEAKSGA